MSITIGDAVLWIRGDSSKLKADTDKAEGEIKSWGQRVGSGLKDSMNFAMGQLMGQGIQQLSDGIQNLSREILQTGSEYAVQVENMVRLTGASAEDSSRMIQVSDDMRLSYDDLSTALKIYSKTQADAGGSTKISTDTLANLSDQYLSLAPGVDRANFLLENFGKSGLAMGKLMEQGGDGIRKMASEVDGSLIMTQQGIDAAREYEVAMDNWNDALDGVKMELAQAFLPVLRDLTQIATNYLIPALQWLVDKFLAMPEPVRATIIVLGALIVGLAQIGPALMGLVGLVGMFAPGGAMAGVAAAVGGGLKAAFIGLGGAIGAISAPVWLLIAALAALGLAVYYFGEDAKKNFLSLSDQWNQIMAALRTRVGVEFTQMLAGMITTLKTWYTNITTTISGWAATIREKFSTVGRGIVDGIWQGIQSGWTWLKDQINGSMESLLSWVKDSLGIQSPSRRFALEVGTPIMQGIGVGFEEQIGTTARRMGVQAAGLPAAMQSVMNQSRYMNVGHVEYHGAFSQSEMARLDQRHDRRAEDILLEALR